jgi:hypothetical protein
VREYAASGYIRPGDILFFTGVGDIGHAAIITYVTSDEIYFRDNSGNYGPGNIPLSQSNFVGDTINNRTQYIITIQDEISISVPTAHR